MRKRFAFILFGLAAVAGVVLVGRSVKRNLSLQNQNRSNQVAFSENEDVGSKASSQDISLPQDEDIIRSFIALINEGKADEAAKMMKIKDQSPLQANSELQAWAVQFAAINSIGLLRIEKASEGESTGNKHIYKVVLDVIMDPASGSAPIPYYGWQNGENTRWIVLEKEDNIWKIAAIATGP